MVSESVVNPNLPPIPSLTGDPRSYDAVLRALKERVERLAMCITDILATGPGGALVYNTVITRKFTLTIGDGAALSYLIPHNLGTQDVGITVYSLVSPFAAVPCTVENTDANDCTVVFSVAPALNSCRAVVLG